MEPSTEQTILQALEFLLSREGIFLERQLAEGEKMLGALTTRQSIPVEHALSDLRVDIHSSRELLDRIRAAKQKLQG